MSDIPKIVHKHKLENGYGYIVYLSNRTYYYTDEEISEKYPSQWKVENDDYYVRHDKRFWNLNGGKWIIIKRTSGDTGDYEWIKAADKAEFKLQFDEQVTEMLEEL